MKVVGLTGGIATGKSTVSSMFADAGAEIIDTDQIAHDVVQKNKPAWTEIISYFGKEILQTDGEINRPYLGDIIFNHQEKKAKLNSIVHPYVFLEIAKQLETLEIKSSNGIVIIDVPLLIEVGMHKGLSDVILVYVPESIQIQRLMERDHLTYDQVIMRIRSQMPIDEKKSFANIVIDNSTDIETTRKRIQDVYAYLSVM
ncbi:MAG: dephospho-CoA kinase [Desulfobacterales bacterium]|nr:dephospho-CoA kinase [Desulfobacterales bacterium]